MNVLLCFGLPGTGKTTYVTSHKFHIRLDLGHNAFRNEEQREKFYKKAKTHTTCELDVLTRLNFIAQEHEKRKHPEWIGSPDIRYWGNKTVYYDTYPEYFSLDEVRRLADIGCIFAIPSIDVLEESVIPRVFERDGDGEFPRLYLKQYKKWHEDWLRTYNQWCSVLGHRRCVKIDLYDDLTSDDIHTITE